MEADLKIKPAKLNKSFRKVQRTLFQKGSLAAGGKLFHS